MEPDFPGRIVCLTEETTETLYLLGEEHRIVGVSGYTARPPEARRKPKVSAFINAKFDRIMELEPDLVLAFSDLQGEIVRELMVRGLNVIGFNQRSIAEIEQMITMLARITGVPEKGISLVQRLRGDRDAIRTSASRFPHRSKVFFEEWNDPLISGIRWVEELIEVAGGEPVFPELCGARAAKQRIVAPEEVAARNPEIIIASWCGRKVDKQAIRARSGWSDVAAVARNRIYEIKSTYILQPGPAALTEGLRQLHAILAHAAGLPVPEGLEPRERTDSGLSQSQVGI